MGIGGQISESVARRYAVLRPYLDERQRRLVLAAEAGELGRGGIRAVALATGVHPDTVAKGVQELEGGTELSGRVRGAGWRAQARHRDRPGSGAGAQDAGRPRDARGPGVAAGCGRPSRPATWPMR